MIVAGKQRRDQAVHNPCIHSSLNSPPTQAALIVDQSALCYTAGPYWLSVLNIAVCICPSRSP